MQRFIDRLMRAVPAAAAATAPSIRAPRTSALMSRRARRALLGGVVAAAAIALPLASAAQADATTYHVRIKAEHSQMFITAPNWTTGPEAAFQWYNADWPESQWNINHNGDGTFQLQDRWNNLCLDLENNAIANGTRVVQMPCDGTISQDWSYNSEQNAGSRFYRHIRNEYSGRVMDIGGASTAAGAQLVTWERHYPAQRHQRFNIAGFANERAAATPGTPRAAESQRTR